MRRRHFEFNLILQRFQSKKFGRFQPHRNLNPFRKMSKLRMVSVDFKGGCLMPLKRAKWCVHRFPPGQDPKRGSPPPIPRGLSFTLPCTPPKKNHHNYRPTEPIWSWIRRNLLSPRIRKTGECPLHKLTTPDLLSNFNLDSRWLLTIFINFSAHPFADNRAKVIISTWPTSDIHKV